MNIPSFDSYGGIESMTPEQLEFYKTLEKNISNNNYMDVDGNISYLFTYAKKIILKLYQRKTKALHRRLILLSEKYRKYEKFSAYCIYWANDCLLALNHLEEYLVETELDPFEKNNITNINIRLTICLKLGKDISTSDSLILSEFRPSEIILENKNIFLDCYAETYYEFLKENGNFFEYLCSEIDCASGEIYLFSGTPALMTAGFKVIDFRGAKETCSLIRIMARVAENKLRIQLGYPVVGEGWISETILYKKIKERFPGTTILQHGRPEFLGLQHYDIWLPHWRIAIEYHGIQHFRSIDYFGGEESFQKTIERDKRKIKLSKDNNVKLFVVTEGYDLDELINKIEHEKTQITKMEFS